MTLAMITVKSNVLVKSIHTGLLPRQTLTWDLNNYKRKEKKKKKKKEKKIKLIHKELYTQKVLQSNYQKPAIPSI